MRTPPAPRLEALAIATGVAVGFVAADLGLGSGDEGRQPVDIAAVGGGNRLRLGLRLILRLKTYARHPGLAWQAE